MLPVPIRYLIAALGVDHLRGLGPFAVVVVRCPMLWHLPFVAWIWIFSPLPFGGVGPAGSGVNLWFL